VKEQSDGQTPQRSKLQQTKRDTLARCSAEAQETVSSCLHCQPNLAPLRVSYDQAEDTTDNATFWFDSWEDYGGAQVHSYYFTVE